MKLVRSLRAAALSAGLALPLLAQQQQSAPPAPPLTKKLDVGPEFVVGTLPNGLHYYIRKNTEPAKRAELRLAVNAGAILEDDDQNGYAHFVEHTAFNGTTHFKKNDLVKYLESIGVRFGADLNAGTGADQTVYQLSVPTDTAKLLETAFVILADWAHGQVFDSTEVVNERGVVVEEWRGSLGASERMRRVWVPMLLKGSKYADRNVIGTEESILKAQPSVLRRFYNDWYRPDLMAVIAVGDFDVERVKQLIAQNFSSIPMPKNPRPRQNFAVPKNTTPIVAIVSDAEATGTSFLVGYKRPRKLVETAGDYRNQMAEQLYFAMLNARLNEIRQKPDAPFLGAGAGFQTFFARDVSAFTFSGAVKDGGIERGLEAVLTEARRVDQFGFLPSELQRAKDNMLRNYEQMYAERAKTPSGAMVGELIRNFLEQEDIPGLQAEYDMTRAFLPGITLDEVNKIARDWITDENRIALITGPRKAGVTLPTEAQILAVFDRAGKASVTAYTETVSDAPLMPKMPTPGKVVGTSTVPSINVTEWKLSNGARVLLKPTDFKADEVLLNAYSWGGTSLVSDADYQSAANAAAIIRNSGVGAFSAVDLGKKLAGKAVAVNAAIGATTETLSGQASPKDIETMFQLINLRFTAPRLDTAAWLAMKGQMEASLANRAASPVQTFFDTLTAVMNSHHPRATPPSASKLAAIDPHRSLEIYKERFANAGDFTFVFVGSFNLDSIKPLVEKYIASLPGTPTKERYKELADTEPKTIIEQTIRKGAAPQAQTFLAFNGPFNYNPRSRFDMLALTTLAQSRVIESLREEMGATYSPQFGGTGRSNPHRDYNIGAQYSSSPDNVDKLAARVFKVADSLRNYPPSEADVQKVKEQLIRGRETNLKTNAYWAGNIAARDQNGEDLAGLLTPYDDMIKNLTAKQIQDAAKLYLDPKSYVKIVLLPEGIRP